MAARTVTVTLPCRGTPCLICGTFTLDVRPFCPDGGSTHNVRLGGVLIGTLDVWSDRTPLVQPHNAPAGNYSFPSEAAALSALVFYHAHGYWPEEV